MKKLFFAVVIFLLIGGAAFLFLKKHDDENMPIGAPSTGSSTPNTPAPSSASTTYKDGSFTGSPVDNVYGTVQVQAVISEGKITDIQFLQMPNLPGHTSEVTAATEPLLKQEAITSQSSNVDIVSGATQDSQSFQQSLASALAQAK